MIYSKVAIDYSKGVTHNNKNGTCKPNKIGCYVLTIKEAISYRRNKDEE